MAHIATRWLERAPTALEGAWAQENSGLTALQVAEVVLQAAPGLFPGRTAQELVAGLQGNAQIVRMDVIPELNQGTAGHDELRIELNRADVHLERTGTDRWEATSLIDGNMAESVGIERLHLKDVSVALDTQGTAGQVAGLLAVLLGSAGLTHQGLAGAGLAALDAGMSVEMLSGLLSAFAAFHFGPTWATLGALLFIWTLLALSFIDFDTQLLPDALTLPLAFLGFTLGLWTTDVALVDRVIGAAAGYLGLLTIGLGYRALRGREGLGLGDAKLLGAIGAWLGWQALPFILLIAASLGLAGALAAMALGRAVQAQSRVPLGTLLAIATLPGWIVRGLI